MLNKKCIKKIISGVLAVGIMCGALSGCGDKEETAEKKTFTIFCNLPATVAQYGTDLNDTEFFKELEKRTGVHIDFIHPAAGSFNEQFNLMLSSGELPDMIIRDWSSYPGAEMQAVKDGLLVELTEYVDEHAPNMKKYVEETLPESEKWVKTEDRWFIVPNLSGTENYKTAIGPIIRKDLLEKYNLDMPTTIKDWENVLTTFKQNGIQYPLTMLDTDKFSHTKNHGIFIGATGIARTFFLEDGEMIYGSTDPRLKEFISIMSDWTKKGLVDPDITTQDNKAYDSKILNSKSGALCGFLTDITNYNLELKKIDPSAELVAAPYPSMEKGEDCPYIPTDRVDGYTYANAVGITSACEDPAAALEWLDYAFSEEGHMLFNYGIEGVSYEMVDGKPVYTELITNNPDGYNMSTALSKYAMPLNHGYTDESYYDQVYQDENAKEAARMWSEQASAVPARMIWRANYKLSADEAKEYNNLIANYESYAAEQYQRWMTGVDSLDNWDSYIEKMEGLGTKRATEIVDKAVKRAMSYGK